MEEALIELDNFEQNIKSLTLDQLLDLQTEFKVNRKKWIKKYGTWKYNSSMFILDQEVQNHTK